MIKVKKLNVSLTKALDLCVSCEICKAICPTQAIVMKFNDGKFVPYVHEEKCIDCGLCIKVCPGIDFDPFSLLNKKSIDENDLDGNYTEVYTAYSKNSRIRKKATSGGIITNLIAELISKKEYEGAFVLNYQYFDGKPARLELIKRPEEIIKASGSKYIPASVYNVVNTLKEHRDKKYIVVGTPCQILGIKKFMNIFNIPDESVLFLGLFCDKTLNFNIYQYFENKYKKGGEKLVRLEFRSKDGNGWPGDVKLTFNTGREIIISRKKRMEVKKYYQLLRCLLCTDKLNKLADISFGDCYIRGKEDKMGKSNVIIRTRKGKDIFEKYKHLFVIEDETIQNIWESQGITNKVLNWHFAKVFNYENNIYPNSKPNCKDEQKFCRTIRKQLKKFQKYIRWGKENKLKVIKLDLAVTNIKTKITRLHKILKYGIALSKLMLLSLFKIKDKDIIADKKTKQNILIVGGGLSNKGAQAMTFTVINEIKKRFPEKKIFLLSSSDFQRYKDKLSIFKFNTLPWNLKFTLEIFGTQNHKKVELSHYRKLYHEIFKNTSMILDISGYALTSQFGIYRTLNYVANIAIAKMFKIPYYILPQSIGPFNYPFIFRPFLYILFKLYLNYPEIIFVREDDGKKWIKKYRKGKIEKSLDIVLQTRKYDIDNIFKVKPKIRQYNILKNSVGIIPNMRVIERYDKKELMMLYKRIIEKLLSNNINIYILRHSYEDLELCNEIKQMFENNKKVILIPDDLYSFELENIIKKFDFVIASRYHSLIHAYKNGVPAIVIGWAIKYYELMKEFDQMQYYFDVRKGIYTKKIIDATERMMKYHLEEKEKISKKINEIISNSNLFNEILL